jgi:hypothetical protein
VATRPEPEQDIDALDVIHAALSAQGLTPAEHVVDTGYITPDVIHHAAVRWGVSLLGPVRSDPRARPGFAKHDFHIDWHAHTLTCPRGVTSPPWKPTFDDGRPRFSVLFPRQACRACTDRLACTGNIDGKGRHITLLPRPQQEIQTGARAEQQTEQWRARYAIRSGCEAIVSQDRPRSRAAPLPLPRPGQDPRSARLDRRRNQYHPAHSVRSGRPIKSKAASHRLPAVMQAPTSMQAPASAPIRLNTEITNSTLSMTR